MQTVKNSLLKTIVAIAFIGLAIGGSVGRSSADSSTGYGGSENQGTTDTIDENTGSGAGGSQDTGTSDTGSSYYNDQQGDSTDKGSGFGTGGSTDTGTDTGNRLRGTGPNYGTAPLGGPSGDGMGNTSPEN
jgi:hypothetical protein